MPEKYHAIMLSKDPTDDNFTVSTDNTRVTPEEVILLGVILDNNLNFNGHIS